MTLQFGVNTGNFTAAATWRAADNTSFLNLITGGAGQVVTTTFVSSSAFTPGAITIEGLAVKINSRSASPSGTFSVRLAVAGVAVPGTTVTINVADMPAFPVESVQGTWIYMKFAAPVLLLAATAYTLQLQTSVASQVTALRNATANNWLRALLTTTSVAPAATDPLFVAGAYTGAGASTPITVTMDNTAGSIWGDTTFGSIEVGMGGTVQYGTAASTNYRFIMGGQAYVGFGGTWRMGSSGTPMPASSTATLEMNLASAVQFDFLCQGTFESYGNPIVDKCFLAANASAGATALTTSVATGWVSGDNIVIAPTTTVAAQTENRTVASSSGTTLNITLGLSNARTIPSGTECEIINLTRNVKILGVTATIYGRFRLGSTASGLVKNISVNYTEFRNIQVVNTTGNVNSGPIRLNYTSHYDMLAANIFMKTASVYDFIVNNFVAYNGGPFVTYATFVGLNGDQNNAQIKNGWYLRTLNTAAAFAISTGPAIWDGLRAVGNPASGFVWGNNSSFFANLSTFSNLIAKNNASSGFVLSLAYDRQTNTCTNWTAYLNNSTGVQFNSSNGFLVDGMNCHSNTPVNLQFTNANNITIKNVTLDAGSVGTLRGIDLGTSSNQSLVILNGSIGETNQHAQGDIRVTGTQLFGQQLAMYNVTLGSATEVALQTAMNLNSSITSSRHDKIDGNYRTWKCYGTIANDDTIFRSPSKSQRLTPNNATYKLESASKYVAVKDGQTITVGCWVRKSVVSDGQAYNGAQPRLILKANPAVFSGTTDVVLATASGAAGTWEYLSGTCTVSIDNSAYEVVVDCAGTQGWVNIDDWKISTTNQTSKEKFWSDGAPTEWVASNQGGGLIIF